jgi:hypothetical protein
VPPEILADAEQTNTPVASACFEKEALKWALKQPSTDLGDAGHPMQSFADSPLQTFSCNQSTMTTRLLQLPSGTQVLLVNDRGMLDAFEVTPITSSCRKERQRAVSSPPGLCQNSDIVKVGCRMALELQHGNAVSSYAPEVDGALSDASSDEYVRSHSAPQASVMGDVKATVQPLSKDIATPCRAHIGERKSKLKHKARSRPNASRHKSKASPGATVSEPHIVDGTSDSPSSQLWREPSKVLTNDLHANSQVWSMMAWSFRSLDIRIAMFMVLLLPLSISLCLAVPFDAACRHFRSAPQCLKALACTFTFLDLGTWWA